MNSFKIYKQLLLFVVAYCTLIVSSKTMAATNVASFEGTFRLDSVFVNNNNQVDNTEVKAVESSSLLVDVSVPQNSEYLIRIKEQENGTAYSFQIKIGNMIGGKIDIVDNDSNDKKNIRSSTQPLLKSIAINDIISTRMLPPPEIDTIERSVNNILRGADTMKYYEKEERNSSNSDKGIVIISGTNGKIQFSRTNKSV